jgi:hypothetical protein
MLAEGVGGSGVVEEGRREAEAEAGGGGKAKEQCRLLKFDSWL